MQIINFHRWFLLMGYCCFSIICFQGYAFTTTTSSSSSLCSSFSSQRRCRGGKSITNDATIRVNNHRHYSLYKQQYQQCKLSPDDDYDVNNNIHIDNNNDDTNNSESSGTLNRRKFFGKSTAISSVPFILSSISLSFPSVALAASSSSSTTTSSSSSSSSTDLNNGMINGKTFNQRVGGLANKIRGILKNMDELQRDLMQERWDLVQNYPIQLRSYIPVFTTYTDAAFPSDSPSDYGLRVALRYEVGRYFGSLERLKRAIARQSLDEAYIAYADMSLHLDRYLRVGGLYTYYDATIDNEPLFENYKDALVYSDPVKDPAEVRDLIVLIKGPDTGKTGIVIGVYTDGSNNCVVKLDKYRGMREIRVVPRIWAAKRLGEQDPDDVFLIPRKATTKS